MLSIVILKIIFLNYFFVAEFRIQCVVSSGRLEQREQYLEIKERSDILDVMIPYEKTQECPGSYWFVPVPRWL